MVSPRDTTLTGPFSTVYVAEVSPVFSIVPPADSMIGSVLSASTTISITASPCWLPPVVIPMLSMGSVASTSAPGDTVRVSPSFMVITEPAGTVCSSFWPALKMDSWVTVSSTVSAGESVPPSGKDHCPSSRGAILTF